MEKISQSALEYTMTYGWAILIIVIVVVVLYSLGIFSPSITVATVTGLSGFQVNAQECVSNFGFFVQVTNQLGSHIRLTQVNFTLSNGTQVASLPLSVGMAPSEQQIFSIAGGCPFPSGSTYVVTITVSYQIISSSFGPYVTSGTFSGTATSQINSFISSLLANSYAFGTSNGNLSLTTEYYSGGIFLGKLSSAFPGNLSDIRSAFIDCNPPYDTQGYTAVSDMYFSSSVSFEIISNDETAVFFKSIGGGAWTSVFSNKSWFGQSNGFWSKSLNVTAGKYEVAVDWSNSCAGGISSLSVGGVISKTSRWNVTDWVPFNASVDILPYTSVNESPTLPKNISVEQTGFWNSSSAVNSCGSNQLCTTIFNDFDLPAGYPWWVDYGNVNVTSTSSFTALYAEPGNYSYSLRPFSSEDGFCGLSYTGAAVSGYLVAGQSTSYIGTPLTENCSVVFDANGLPSGNKWNVTLDRGNRTAESPTNITFYPSSRISSFKARQVTAGADTYYPCPAVGNVSSGSYVRINYSTINLCSPTDYLVSSIYETNLPQFLGWSANYNGLLKSSNVTQALSFTTTAGNYSFSIKPILVDYYTTGCIGNFSANKSSGYLVAGKSRTINFTQKLNCSAAFEEYGLPRGLSDWNVTYNSSTHISSALPSNVSFYTSIIAANGAGTSASLPTPGYGTFKVYDQVYGGTEYYPCPSTGKLPSGSVETIIYSTSPSCPYV